MSNKKGTFLFEQVRARKRSNDSLVYPQGKGVRNLLRPQKVPDTFLTLFDCAGRSCSPDPGERGCVNAPSADYSSSAPSSSAASASSMNPFSLRASM